MDATTQAAVDAALSRWSVVVQMGVITVFAATFLLLWRATRRRFVRTWSLAWAADVLALVAVLAVAFAPSGTARSSLRWLYTTYGVAKGAFAFLLVAGLAQLAGVRLGPVSWVARRAPLVAGTWAAALWAAGPQLVRIQLATYAMVAGTLLPAGVVLALRGRAPGTRPAALALAGHGALFGHHLWVMLPAAWGGGIPVYMSRISFVDAVAELVVGMLALVAVARSVFEEMASANAELEAAHRRLRELVDVDPLTGLWNRRRLRRFVEELHPGGGTVIYLDIDGFKSINDRWGHAVGDRCLERVAAALREVFRAGDGLFRIGGDEFLVVAPGLAGREAARRVRRVREAVRRPREGSPPLSVSAGVATFGEGTPFDTALDRADAAMYRSKGGRRSA